VVRCGLARCGKVWHPKGFEAGWGTVWYGQVRRGGAGYGEVRFGEVWNPQGLTEGGAMFSDRGELEADIAMLNRLGFTGPKWTFKMDVPISEISCSNRKLLCDIVAFNNGTPIVAIERDGAYHNEEFQKRRDEAKERILAFHGIRLWRWWNSASNAEHQNGGRVFRRGIKGLFYALPGTLRSDYKRQCNCKVR